MSAWRLSILAAVASAVGRVGTAREAGDLGRSGTVRFPVAAAAGIQEDFDTAVALLHSFFYDEARRRFEEITRRDPSCAMAWWGVAMTYYHPLWAPPTEVEIREGFAASRRALDLGGKTPRERGFIEAIGTFFAASDASSAKIYSETCHGPRDHAGKAIAYGRVMERLHRELPDDDEVTTFYALSLLGTADPADKTYPNALRAAGCLEPLFARLPNHPGVIHYLIHAYDYPELAPRGLAAARRYAEVAPWVPHVLHMPSHIFTRLGLWRESIDSNLGSIEAARDYMARWHGGATSMDELHATDYAVFAWLQTDRGGRALETVDRLSRIRQIHPAREMVGAHALAAISARTALELRDWVRAASLEPPQADVVGAYPFTESLVEFARAVGRARTGDVAGAERSVARLKELRESIKDRKWKFWIGQVEVQQRAAAGWLAFARKDGAAAERSLREAADLEDASGIHPVNPGAVLPAREQLGDLLLELGRPADALREYQTAQRSSPDRLNGLHGAARAAELAGEAGLAREKYARLLEVTEGGEGRRPEILHARAFLAGAAPAR